MKEQHQRIPTTPGEKLQYLGHIASDYAVRFVLIYPERLDLQILRKAAAYMIGSVPVLHASFVPENRPYWLVNQTYSEEDTVIPVYVDPKEDLLEAANTQALHNAPYDGRFQIRCTLLDNGSQSALVLAVSHIVADGGDAKYILKKLIELYNCFLEGKDPASVSIKNGNRSVMQAFDNVDPRVLENKKEKTVGDNVSKVRISFSFPEPAEVGTARILYRRIPTEELRIAREKGKKEGAAVNDLLLAAYYRSIRKLLGLGTEDPLAITSTIDLRQYMRSGDSEGICNLSSLMPTKLTNGVGGSFRETLVRVIEQTDNVKNNGMAGIHNVKLVGKLVGVIFDLPLGLLTRLGRASGGISISLTNLGNMTSAELCAGGTAPACGYFASLIKQKPCIQVGVMSIDGSPVLTIATVCGDQDAAVMNRVLDGILEELRCYGSEP